MIKFGNDIKRFSRLIKSIVLLKTYLQYSRTFRKRPPKMQQLSGRLQESNHREALPRRGPVCGCSLHYWVSRAINKRGFSRLHLCRHTFASLWGDCLRFVSLWRVNSRGDSCVLGVHLPNVCWGVLFLFVKRSYFKSLLKVYYRSVFVESSKVFNILGKILL